MAARLKGALDQDALQKALETLVQRHEVLRTVFVSVEGDPRQEIATELAKKRVAAGEQAQALQQGLAQDLKKLQEVTAEPWKPVHWSDLPSTSPSSSPTPKKQ